MRARALRGVTLACFLVALAGSVRGADRDPVSESIQRSQPDRFIYSYDWRTDTFVHGYDISSRPPTWRLGSDWAYWGNRLEQFQFFGPAAQGGIYEAFRLHHEELNLDPKRYRYHR